MELGLFRLEITGRHITEQTLDRGLCVVLHLANRLCGTAQLISTPAQAPSSRSVRCKEGQVPGGCSVLNGDKAPKKESSCAGNIPNTPKAYECKQSFTRPLTRRDWRVVSRSATETTGRRQSSSRLQVFTKSTPPGSNAPGPTPCSLAAKHCSSQFLAVRAPRHSRLTLQSRRTPQTRSGALAKQSSQGWNSACDEPNSKRQDPRPLEPCPDTLGLRPLRPLGLKLDSDVLCRRGLRKPPSESVSSPMPQPACLGQRHASVVIVDHSTLHGSIIAHDGSRQRKKTPQGFRFSPPLLCPGKPGWTFFYLL